MDVPTISQFGTRKFFPISVQKLNSYNGNLSLAKRNLMAIMKQKLYEYR